jgi:hypothetical protein
MDPLLEDPSRPAPPPGSPQVEQEWFYLSQGAVKIGKDEVLVPIGLIYEALLLLRFAGFRYRILVSLPKPLERPDRAVFGLGGALDEAVLSLFRDWYHGLIRYDEHHVDPARLVAQLALAYPTKRFLVVAHRRQEILSFGPRLRELIEDVAWDPVGSGSMPPDRRILVAAFAACRDPNRPMVVVLDPLSALGRDNLCLLRSTQPLRLFGLLERGSRHAPRDADDLLATFGPYTVTVPAHGLVERPVVVTWQEVRGGPPLDRRLDGVELLRRGLWRNPFFQRRAAGLARDLAASGPGQVGRLLPDIVGGFAPGPRPSVVLLVETLEHALALGDRLPDWTILTGPEVECNDLSEEQRARLRAERPRDAGPLRAIATPRGLGTGAADAPDILIRADGGVGLPDRLATGWSARYDAAIAKGRATDAQGRRPLVLVDFVDLRHPALTERAETRRRAYAERGWDGAMVRSYFAPGLERFAASRRRA